MRAARTKGAMAIRLGRRIIADVHRSTQANAYGMCRVILITVTAAGSKLTPGDQESIQDPKATAWNASGWKMWHVQNLIAYIAFRERPLKMSSGREVIML